MVDFDGKQFARDWVNRADVFYPQQPQHVIVYHADRMEPTIFEWLFWMTMWNNTFSPPPPEHYDY